MWKVLLGVLAVCVAGALAAPSGVEAQAGIDLFAEEICRENPHSEDCICVHVRRFGLVPIYEDGNDTPEPDPDPLVPEPDRLPVFDSTGGIWLGVPQQFDEDGKWIAGNLQFIQSDSYGEHCSLAYVREDMRRLWRFVASVSALMAAMSFAWAGVMYMQDSASGGDVSKSRGVVIRVVVGLILVGSAYIVWEGASGFTVQHLDNWTLDFGKLHDF